MSYVTTSPTSPGPSTLSTPTSHVHLEYDSHNLPPKPSRSGSWTRFVCISDSHGARYDVPDGDVLLHSGDLTETGLFGAFEETTDWLFGLPHTIKIVIAGDHDVSLHRGWYESNAHRWHGREPVAYAPILNLLTGPQARSARLIYLQDQAHRFQVRPNGRTWTIYGSPWQPSFSNHAFQYKPDEQAERIISKFPKTDILLTHGPPAGILDELRHSRISLLSPSLSSIPSPHTTKKGGRGCPTLARALSTGVLTPRLHVFGHIHESHGAEIHRSLRPTRESSTLDPPGDEDKQTIFVNAASQHAGPLSGSTREWAGKGWKPVIVDLLDDDGMLSSSTERSTEERGKKREDEWGKDVAEYTPTSLIDDDGGKAVAGLKRFPYIVPTSFLE